MVRFSQYPHIKITITKDHAIPLFFWHICIHSAYLLLNIRNLSVAQILPPDDYGLALVFVVDYSESVWLISNYSVGKAYFVS
jgi:hypothetical protein